MSERGTQYLLESYTRLYKALGKDFIPYLPKIMNNLLITLMRLVPEAKIYNSTAEIPSHEYDWERSILNYILLQGLT
jgi:hypothetical protein